MIVPLTHVFVICYHLYFFFVNSSDCFSYTCIYYCKYLLSIFKVVLHWKNKEWIDVKTRPKHHYDHPDNVAGAKDNDKENKKGCDLAISLLPMAGLLVSSSWLLRRDIMISAMYVRLSWPFWQEYLDGGIKLEVGKSKEEKWEKSHSNKVGYQDVIPGQRTLHISISNRCSILSLRFVP